MITELEFKLLRILKGSKETQISGPARKPGYSANYNQRELASVMGVSLGTINNTIKSLSEKCLIDTSDGLYAITPDGITVLDSFKVDNAIIMAAGMSSRFAPLSYEKPKGLLVVKGEVLIEREIRQLQEAGITDITVVVGYMMEKFFYLADRFGVKIVTNDDYYKYNNTSTLIRVLDRLKNTYICSSDNYFVDNVFEPYVYQAYYSAVYAAGKTDEYCLSCDGKGRIKNVTIGGENSWYMLGHVYFDRKFSEAFSKILKDEYPKPETKECLWENLYMRHIDELTLYIRKYDAGKVLEFDSLEELRTFDPEYINNTDSRIFGNICRILNCEEKDICRIKAIKAGLTNTSFQFNVFGTDYVYRHPGRGTEKYINRTSEAFSMSVAAQLGLDNTYIYMNPEEGWKISKFVINAREMDYHNPAEVSKALDLVRKLHSQNIKSEYDFGIWGKTLEFIDRLSATGKIDFEGFDELHAKMERLMNLLDNDGHSVKCLCHNDCYSPNFLLDDNDDIYLIDWEYSGNDDPASDLGTFICCSDYTFEEAVHVIEEYLGHQPDNAEKRHFLGYVAVASYYWYIWALYQETRGNSVGEWLYLWYKNVGAFSNAAFELYETEQ